jgi:hypothetical protein
MRNMVYKLVTYVAHDMGENIFWNHRLLCRSAFCLSMYDLILSHIEVYPAAMDI